MDENKQRVVNVIQEAFRHVALGRGVGLWQSQGIDDYADEKELLKLWRGDEKRDWKNISVDDLNRCNSSLCFFDAAGMRFHLPAILIADLNGNYHHEILYSLTKLDELDGDTRGLFSLFSEAQRAAVREYLLLLKNDPDYEYEMPSIEQALKNFE